MRLALVGATGLVGRTMLRVLEERQVPIDELILLASPRSAGSVIAFRGTDHVVRPLTNTSFDGVQVALFSAGGSVSREFAPIAAAAGCTVIDNSSAWRMDPNVPLVVPEVNPDDVAAHRGIIANPNCSTIQMVVALKPLADRYGLRRLVVSTYQSVSGAGQHGVDQLMDELAGREPASRISSHPLAFNTVFHGFGPTAPDTEEEAKMMRETRRIMHLPDLPMAVTCVRVPVIGGHGEAIAVELDSPVDPSDVRDLYRQLPGIVVLDDPDHDQYPTAQIVKDTDPVYVGRIRRDASVPHGLLMWVAADNLRKGAATNAVQILELLAQ